MSDSKHPTVEQLSGIDLDSLPDDGGPEYNRLIFEKSPYLLQHATNPIAWRAWNDTTLELARQENKPIFLSIGYSTCHWCHVMADESFADREVAGVLNENYVAIKVDREERPDIDATYMQACQLMTGSGGWPLTLILTPEQIPFFAATYIPKHDQRGMTGLISLLQRIIELWHSERDRIDTSAGQLHEALLKTDSIPPADDLPGEETLLHALRDYSNQYDSLHGGFGTAPKFPAPHNLSLLLDLGCRPGAGEGSAMALDTLRAIRLGGIYDQLAGGIHRYSVDERWLVPHFEKMLYDQALLIIAATDGWLYSGDEFYRDIAIDTAGYVTRSLQLAQGGFYCGEDADSEGSEGTCYLWTKDEISDHCPDHIAADIIRMFGVTRAGNFEGKNILYLPEGLDNSLLSEARRALLPVREQRPRPHRDDKIITAWNGLSIAALARLGALSGQSEWVRAAEQTAMFIKKHLCTEDGRLLRRWRQGEASIPAFLEDYSFSVWGLIELYQARFRVEYLQWALQLAEDMLRLFADGDGGLYDTGSDAEKVLTRGRNLQDGAIPSGNGAAALALARVGQLCGREDLRSQAEKLLLKNAGMIRRYPTGFSVSLRAASYLDGRAATLIIGGGDEVDRNGFLEIARAGYRPGLEIMILNDEAEKLRQLAPLAGNRETERERATAWLCRGRSCQPQANEPEQLAGLLA